MLASVGTSVYKALRGREKGFPTGSFLQVDFLPHPAFLVSVAVEWADGKSTTTSGRYRFHYIAGSTFVIGYGNWRCGNRGII